VDLLRGLSLAPGIACDSPAVACCAHRLGCLVQLGEGSEGAARPAGAFAWDPASRLPHPSRLLARNTTVGDAGIRGDRIRPGPG
jgi:hypothetical protein